MLTGLGALLGGLTYETVSHQLPFFLLLGLTLLQLLLTLFLVLEPKKQQT
jgi:predicted MFS family arabinose efflux permease